MWLSDVQWLLDVRVDAGRWQGLILITSLCIDLAAVCCFQVVCTALQCRHSPHTLHLVCSCLTSLALNPKIPWWSVLREKLFTFPSGHLILILPVRINILITYAPNPWNNTPVCVHLCSKRGRVVSSACLGAVPVLSHRVYQVLLHTVSIY